MAITSWQMYAKILIGIPLTLVYHSYNTDLLCFISFKVFLPEIFHPKVSTINNFGIFIF